MSQYHYPYDYGQYQGQQPPQQPISQNSFDFNANHIPGLGITGPPTGGNSYHVTPTTGSWPHPYSSPANIQAASQPKQAEPSSGGRHPQAASPKIVTATTAKAPTQPVLLAAHTVLNSDVEEGELSEGQFEDLYEPRQPARPAHHILPRKPPPAVIQSQPTSAIDTPDAEFYGNDEEDGEAAANEKPDTVAGRERSGSYSPFLSPREIQSDGPTPPGFADNATASKPSSGQTQSNTQDQMSLVPGLKYTPQGNSIGSKFKPAQIGTQTSHPPGASLGPFKSLPEAKKEAQKAILRLWPLGVKFQDYIGEGFDEKVVKGLFDDLHLDTTLGKLEPSQISKQKSPPRQVAAAAPLKARQSAESASASTKDTTSTTDQKGKGEERKDRIARLLALKASKAPTAPAATASNPKQPPSQPKSNLSQESQTNTAASPAAPPKSKSYGEKELLIQQRMAALQKSREAQAQAQAQKLATSKPSSGATQASDNGGNSVVSQPSLASSRPESSAATQDQTSRSQTASSIPGLLMSAAQQTLSAHPRKRPVALDFVEYSSTVGPLKRPFGQDRKETSLVIDVSDASDDEEMDMDMESPVEDPSSMQNSGTPAQRGPSIRDFPPLTDMYSRQFSSPAPQSHTPPGGLVNGKKRETELDLEIQEMKRKIAEAEARRLAKKSSAESQTPNQTRRTPELKDNEPTQPPPARQVVSMSSSDRSDGPSAQLISEAASAKLPKRSELSQLGHLEKVERRGRIVSLDLPRIDESVEKKMNRLRQLREEELRLQAEIDERLAEKKRLTEELDQLATTPTDTTPQSSELDSSVASVPPPPQTGSASGAGDLLVLSSTTSPYTSEQSDETDDVSMDEDDDDDDDDEPSQESSQQPTPSREASEPQQTTANEISASAVATQNDLDVNTVNEDDAVNSLGETSQDSSSPEVTDSLESQREPEAALPRDDVVSDVIDTGDKIGTDISQPDTAAVIEIASTGVPPQTDPTKLDETTPMELESSSSPAPASPISNSIADGNIDEAGLPDQISVVAQPREEIQEIETEGARESAPASKAALMPYDSPLRYFHGYRFHSGYKDAVPGGLKSLTYSNRIDVLKPLCPDELAGRPCSESCKFQHMKSISAPDDQILLELGKADEYSGEQKARFIQGLREVLQQFRNNKVKDFDAIAQGIVEYRSRFSGDKSKVLPSLEGVTL
ncbi:hypothetical protein B0T17DRAFT_588395 [Bombardia bombarda]|uniref:Putative zinc-finger domain-containing protein n=1 Tax=Bombardia bombarda TaxID=252184 RepID=A0AA39X6I4_9PEZI|nr:hypothetical protein B0T17DRAFT_588395 [Bombardia bombarda]